MGNTARYACPHHHFAFQLKGQLSLLDVDRIGAGVVPLSGGSAAVANGESDVDEDSVHPLGNAVNRKFVRRDPLFSGMLSARELGLALEDIGVSLQPREVYDGGLTDRYARTR